MSSPTHTRLRIGTHIVLRVKESHRFTILAYLVFATFDCLNAREVHQVRNRDHLLRYPTTLVREHLQRFSLSGGFEFIICSLFSGLSTAEPVPY